MGVTLFALRMSDNLHQMEQNNLKLTKISRKLRQATQFSSAIADGTINPDEIAGIGREFFSDAIDFMGYANDTALEVADEQTNYYTSVYGDITAQDYYQNSGLAAQAQLYFDEDGNLDEDAIMTNFYEEALKEYAEEFIAPLLNEMETELQNEKDRLETENEQLSAEYDSLKEAKSQAIQRETISLS